MVKGTRGKGKAQFEEGTRWEIVHIPRFNGRDNVFLPWYRLKRGKMNFRLYYGGVFVTDQKKRVTTYEPGPTGYNGLSLHPNVEEACYFEFVYWIRHELKYDDVGQIWFRKKGCTLFNGRKQLESDKEIPELLESPDSDGWYNLYVVHHERVQEVEGNKGQDDEDDDVLEDEYDEFRTADNVEDWFNVEHLVGLAKKGKGVAESSSQMVPPEEIDNPRSENTCSQITLSTIKHPSSFSQQTNPKKTPSSNTFRKPNRSNPAPRSKKWLEAAQVAIDDSEVAVVEGEHQGVVVEGFGESDGSDAEWSDNDNEDDDLFAENVDAGITERVTRSLGGAATQQLVQLDGGQNDGQQDGIVDLDADVVLNESDEESIPDSDDERGIHYPVFNPDVDFKDKIQLSLGLKFPSFYVFRRALRYHAIESGYNYYFLHNDSKRVTVFCVNKCGCNWKHGRIVMCTCGQTRKCMFKVHCRKVKGESTVQIKALNLTHICGRQHVNNKVTSQYLAERFLDEWKDTPTWKLRDFMVRARRVTGVTLGYFKCYRAREKAMKMIHGDAADQYRRVWDYCEAIRAYNPGSTAVVKCIGMEHPPPLFQRMYVCLQPCKEGFMAGCRPILGVDGCHLRGPVPGICLAAVGKDGNNNLFPVAWAIVEVENSETWEWFLELLVADLGSVAQDLTWVGDTASHVTWMSDRQKGLLEAFNKVIPRAEIRFCCRHIWANFKLKFSGVLFKQYFYREARASTKFHFDQQMEAIKLISQDAYNYLNKIPPKYWSRHAFSSRSKSGMLLNNVCESFNNVIREARSMPIIGMMEWIRRWVMKRCCAKREGLAKFEGVIMPSVVKMIERASEEVSKCDVTQADVHEFEVDHVTTGETYVVNLQTGKCGCFRWELLGIPCYHALACIALQRFNWEDYVHTAYHISTYAKTYAPAFHPMPGKNQWPKSTLPEPLPPEFKKQPGRPKGKKRIKEPGEGQDAYVVRPKKQNGCKKCGQTGHYQKTCKNPPAPVNAEINKGGRPKNAQPVFAGTSSQSGAATSNTTAPPNSTSQAAAKSGKKRGRPPAANASKSAPKTSKGAAAKVSTAPATSKGPTASKKQKTTSASVISSQASTS